MRMSPLTDMRSSNSTYADGNEISKEVQYAFVLKFDLPVVALVDSAGKSLHAVIRVDAKVRGEFDERVALIWSLFPNGSIDRGNKNPSRYTRLPGFQRENGAEPQTAGHSIWSSGICKWHHQASRHYGLGAGCVAGAAFLNLIIPTKRVIINDWLKEGEVG